MIGNYSCCGEWMDEGGDCVVRALFISEIVAALLSSLLLS